MHRISLPATPVKMTRCSFFLFFFALLKLEITQREAYVWRKLRNEFRFRRIAPLFPARLDMCVSYAHERVTRDQHNYDFVSLMLVLPFWFFTFHPSTLIFPPLPFLLFFVFMFFLLLFSLLNICAYIRVKIYMRFRFFVMFLLI